MLAWYQDDIVVVGSGTGAGARFRPVSWAESIRASMPVFPSLSGDEIIIVRSRTLDEVEAAVNINWRQISDFLRGQPIAAVIVDCDPPLAWPSPIPMLQANPPFLETAETAINRSITERRSELFRVGADLARALSVLSLSGAGVTAVLNAAEKITGVSMLLVDSRQRVVSKSPHALPGISDMVISEPLRVAGSASGFNLVTNSDISVGADICRLVLSQTSQQLGLLIDRGTIKLPAGELQSDNARLVSQLLAGTHSTAASSQDFQRLESRFGGRPMRVALLTSLNERIDCRIRDGLPPHLQELGTSIEPFEYSLVIPEGERRRYLNPLLKWFRRLVCTDTTARLAISESARETDAIAGLYQDAKALTRLIRAGILRGQVADHEDQTGNGVEGVLYRFWRHGDGEMFAARSQLVAFSNSLLGGLEARDKRQDSDLVATLTAYVNSGGISQMTSKQLGIHRNTMAYRLNLINTIIDHDINDPDTQTLYRLALAIRNLETTLS